MSVNEDRYLLAAAALVVVTPFLVGGYVYFFFKTTYAQRQAVQASQNWVRVLDVQAKRP